MEFTVPDVHWAHAAWRSDASDRGNGPAVRPDRRFHQAPWRGRRPLSPRRSRARWPRASATGKIVGDRPDSSSIGKTASTSAKRRSTCCSRQLRAPFHSQLHDRAPAGTPNSVRPRHGSAAPRPGAPGGMQDELVNQNQRAPPGHGAAPEARLPPSGRGTYRRSLRARPCAAAD